jgi:RNA polymerase sigma-70 factor (ECF subfamily)
MRAVGREVPLLPACTSEDGPVAGPYPDQRPQSQPSQAAMHGETRNGLSMALDRLGPLDREVLQLRHFELLTIAEIAQVLAITEEAARKRYRRALKRLRKILGDMPSGLWEIGP